jgi:pilus assembly protein CpaF
MALRERLIREPGFPGTGNGNGNATEHAPHSFQEIKSRLHRTLINRMDLSKLSSLTPEQVHAEVSRLAENVLAQEALPLSAS